MGRRKQAHPHRSGGSVIENNDATKPGLTKQKAQDEVVDVDRPYFAEVDRSSWVSDRHLDISEIVLTDLNLGESTSGFSINEDVYCHPRYSLRFRVCSVRKFVGRIKLGHWPLLPSSDVTLEFFEKSVTEENAEMETMIFSGKFDGPDDGITALVHLASMKFMTLRPLLGVTFSEDMSSLRLRVEILKSAFDACESLLDNSRQLWKKSMVNVMAWLRPEVMTSEARYGVSNPAQMDVNLMAEIENGTSGCKKQTRFDVAGLYEAIKPSKAEPMLEDDIPDLLPVLRPYQRRAAYWMVRREKRDLASLGKRGWLFSPLCMPVNFLDTCSKMFYNPFSGSVSLQPEDSSSYVFGGILSDEMGLGKTVELLACIFANQMPESEDGTFIDMTQGVTEDQEVNLRRLKKECVECTCGAVSESRKYKGLWVQCDICDAWQHADCVGYSPRGKKKRSTVESLKQTRKKNMVDIVVRDGEHVCQLCKELMQAINSPVATGATLIICPAPILPQWHSEIICHTRPGSLKICVYEGVRNPSLSNASTVDISELVCADIVLTTYDVLKEDLSHDSDRHEGDRRLMRFQKRYPVLPTLLTRIFWWRICLDEAQMVETNTTAATEMALRLYAKHRWCITGTPIQRKLDDLYGLIRFLKLSPFNTSRWWIEVIRDPYERGDVGAMEFTHKFFKEIMWRSSKKLVADELQLPPQEECISWLAFSPIEQHFYQRQHETCVDYAHEVIESLKDDILKRDAPGSSSSYDLSNRLITHAEAAKLLNSLLKLCQACCHPQVGSSGLRSLQQTPLTMEEILMVLIGKTKNEGEEALRKLVMALNGLAGIAIIEKNFSQAVSLYKEALSLVEEHSQDFRLDPLLNIHLHHNLAEILPLSAICSKQSPSDRQQSPGSSAKRRKLDSKDGSYVSIASEANDHGTDFSENGFGEYRESDIEKISASCSTTASLRTACENLKQKYLSVFRSKLCSAQQDFRKQHRLVCNTLNDKRSQHAIWWLETIHHAECNKDFSNELIRKIEEAISGASNNTRSSRVASRFRSISGLKYHIQSCLDLLEASRRTLFDRLLEIDQTMENPNEDDIGRVRYCRICYGVDDGPICVHCKLDESFQDYEARLFRLKKSHGGLITSAEEAVDLQKKNSSLNRFYWSLSQPNKNSNTSSVGNEESKRRDVRDTVVVSKSPSELEVVLGVIKNCCKAQLGREGMLSAGKQLHILEGMRKEYAHARSLAIAQAQYLRAHDEIKMATARLHLKENENDMSIDALSPDELASASVSNSSEKFISMAMLSRIKGKLRYLKGLVKSKTKPSVEESSNNSSLTEEIVTNAMSNSTDQKSECQSKADEEACPICQENLRNQKMVFQCGHVTCCRCLFAMTEHRLPHDNKVLNEWVICPTCRQRTDFGNIAYADDTQNILRSVRSCEKSEASLRVQGSYGTKIEAVTRRILWIKSTEPKAKVLVFSSWNDVLDVLEHSFNANNVMYIRMKGGRKSQVAISKFRGQNASAEGESVQVLLLLIQHGANGLNLLEAQHVVLVEPLLNPAAEAQAISRVHRIGQANKTLVHRFIVTGTVEESIYKLNRSRNTSLFISGNTKNQDQPLLTFKDVEALFAAAPVTESDEKPPTERESLRHLPPSVAAAIAAEKRLQGNTAPL